MKRFAAACLALALGLTGADTNAAGNRLARAVRNKPAPKTKAAPAPAAAEPEPDLTPEPAATDNPATPAPEPVRAPASTPPPAEKPRAAGPTVESLRAEYDELRDQLFRSRARRETLETALFSTQLLPTIRWEGGRHHVVKHAEVRFDGIRLWETNDGLTSDKPVALAPKSAPPGAHVLGVRVEVRSRDDSKLGYVSDQTFAVSLPEGKKTTVEISIDEDGRTPSYDPEVEIDIKSK